MATKPVGVIFDFDGVVVDSLAVHIVAWQQAFLELYKEELIDTNGLAGRSTASIASILAARAGQPATAPVLADLKRTVLKTQTHKILPLPGALEAFALLKDSGIPFGIASNAPRAFILHTLATYGIVLGTVLGSDDVARPKPEPDIFLKCAREIGLKFTEHARVIVFEDSCHGIKAAVSAGMFPIGVTTQNSPEELRESGAKATCLNVGDAISLGWLNELPSF